MISALMRKVHGPIYAQRQRVLQQIIAPLLRDNDSLLDVGCGSGTLAASFASCEAAPAHLTIRGLERHPRDPNLIPVDALVGNTFPYEDKSFDVVTILDVLHHDDDPVGVLKEAARVSRRLVIVKDHKPEGLLAYRRICLLDWAANRPYGVKCLYDYPSHAGWKDRFAQANLVMNSELTNLRLYPSGWNWFFAGRLHYLAVLSPSGSP